MSGRSRIMTHMVSHYPDRAASLSVARALVDGGCAYLELQFPFSDPTADGPAIQKACADALAGGFTVTDGLRLTAEIRRFTGVPIYVMAYANIAFARGVEKFLREVKEAGASGVIVPDLPPDYDEGLFEASDRAGVDAMPVISPSISASRLRRIAALGRGTIYATLRIGTTGPVTAIDDASVSFLAAIGRECGSREPRVFGGFGVTRREQVAALEPHVHAVVVGSALVREVTGSRPPYAAVRDTVRELAGG